ncbi:hypothetical protein WA026_008819 [Henosepilachna vigintioctopunctata]|uniref:Uncharacterized protein n=1 Tax=Henosepilachna vigintioctopunctata TaxID=420089 RepID=A0AAW1V9B0_9CUCU
MFSLWYTFLAWRDYNKVTSSKVVAEPENEQISNGDSKIPPEVPTVKPEPSRIPLIDNTHKTTSVPKLIPQNPTKSIPSPQSTNTKIPSPEPIRPIQKTGLEPPLKPPRSPSPHPMRSEAFDDIEFDSEESEEEDEENSVIDSTVFNQNMKASNVKDFLAGEINNLEKESS